MTHSAAGMLAAPAPPSLLWPPPHFSPGPGSQEDRTISISSICASDQLVFQADLNVRRNWNYFTFLRSHALIWPSGREVCVDAETLASEGRGLGGAAEHPHHL